MFGRVRRSEGYPPVPVLVTIALHLWERRTCAKVGHDPGLPGAPLFTCRRCGWIEQPAPWEEWVDEARSGVRLRTPGAGA